MSTGEEQEPKPVFFLAGCEVKTPPFSPVARREAGELLRMLQDGDSIPMPRSRPMPSIGPGVHELRVRDVRHNWRVVYRIEPDVILVVHVFAKKTRATPPSIIATCKRRLRDFDAN